jgi:DNA-binding NtrC family response regulator
MAVPDRTVLVVDDDPGIRQMLRLALESAGYVVRVDDGRGPLDLPGVDVVLLDVRLGSATAQDLLSAHPDLAERPIVAMTASGSPRSAVDGLPAREVLAKPFDLDALEDAIDRAIEQAPV